MKQRLERSKELREQLETEEADLRVAETLQSLRVGGRMVGIITHIPELRDEFAQQVIVTKHQGFSTVEVRGLAETA